MESYIPVTEEVNGSNLLEIKLYLIDISSNIKHLAEMMLEIRSKVIIMEKNSADARNQEADKSFESDLSSNSKIARHSNASSNDFDSDSRDTLTAKYPLNNDLDVSGETAVIDSVAQDSMSLLSNETNLASDYNKTVIEETPPQKRLFADEDESIQRKKNS